MTEYRLVSLEERAVAERIGAGRLARSSSESGVGRLRRTSDADDTSGDLVRRSCSVCEVLLRGLQKSYCSARCRQQAYRDRHPDRIRVMERERQARRERIDDPMKKRAWNIFAHAIRHGRIERQPCEECGTTVDVEGHHDDYSKPLAVRWLCRKHHNELHHPRPLRGGKETHVGPLTAGGEPGRSTTGDTAGGSFPPPSGVQLTVWEAA